MSFTYMRIKNHLHINVFALKLALKLRLVELENSQIPVTVVCLLEKYLRYIFSGRGLLSASRPRVVLSFGDILKCDHSNDSYWAVLNCGTVYHAVYDGSSFFSAF